MSATALTNTIPTSASTPKRALDQLRHDPAYQAFTLLRIAFTVAPIAFGIDKFFNVLVNWESYLAPWIRDISPLSTTHTMEVVGVIEIIAGIVVNLLSYSGYYDIALRDFGLMLAALTLGRLASKFDPPWSFRAGHPREKTAASYNEEEVSWAERAPVGR